MAMMTRRDAAIALDIPLEMAKKHGLPARMSNDEFRELNDNPPAWLAQSRANRTGKKPVWVHLVCEVCGFAEFARPKKWWPEFTYLYCGTHSPAQLPAKQPGTARSEYQDITDTLFGVVDTAV